jgi:hypothetical protein
MAVCLGRGEPAMVARTSGRRHRLVGQRAAVNRCSARGVTMWPVRGQRRVVDCEVLAKEAGDGAEARGSALDVGSPRGQMHCVRTTNRRSRVATISVNWRGSAIAEQLKEQSDGGGFTCVCAATRREKETSLPR